MRQPRNQDIFVEVFEALFDVEILAYHNSAINHQICGNYSFYLKTYAFLECKLTFFMLFDRLIRLSLILLNNLCRFFAMLT